MNFPVEPTVAETVNIAEIATVAVAWPANTELDENPYSAPQVDGVTPMGARYKTAFQLHQLGYTLRIHLALTLVMTCLGVVLWDANWDSSFILAIAIIAVFVFAAMMLTTVILTFQELPFPVAAVVVLTLFSIFSWPLTFTALQLWGRRILKKHEMPMGLFSAPRHVAQLAD